MLKQLGPSEPYAYLPAPNPTDLKRRLLVLSERGKVSLQFSKGHQFSNGAPARECICWVIWRRGSPPIIVDFASFLRFIAELPTSVLTFCVVSMLCFNAACTRERRRRYPGARQKPLRESLAAVPAA